MAPKIDREEVPKLMPTVFDKAEIKSDWRAKLPSLGDPSRLFFAFSFVALSSEF